MIENWRTGLCWRLFMANPEIEPMLRAAALTRDARFDGADLTDANFQDARGYPAAEK